MHLHTHVLFLKKRAPVKDWKERARQFALKKAFFTLWKETTKGKMGNTEFSAEKKLSLTAGLCEKLMQAQTD